MGGGRQDGSRADTPPGEFTLERFREARALGRRAERILEKVGDDASTAEAITVERDDDLVHVVDRAIELERYQIGQTDGYDERIFERVETLKRLLALRDALDAEAVTA